MEGKKSQQTKLLGFGNQSPFLTFSRQPGRQAKKIDFIPL